MSKNLITAGIITPTQWPLARVWLEVSAVLKTPPRQIEQLELWPHLIWVNIVGYGAVFVSYRCLPLWVESSLAAIQQCSDRSELDQLGDLFKAEIKSHHKHYTPAVIEQWRLAWAEKAKQFKLEDIRQAQEEERLRPYRERQQACQNLQQAWKSVLHYCQSLEALETLKPELQLQSQNFADLPEGENTMQLWQDRKRELIEASA
ncbi:MAG: hypothetical protein WBA13_07100 [Microcoleaceae cyanobacterium]